ncbi:MAG: mechanosensitive ion channel [Corynebacterium sp.]|nr:mechanosensitive ion channel [Corynebacterium sp.]
MPFLEILQIWWAWVATTGLDVAMWIVLAILVPRIGRLIMRIIDRSIQNEDENEAKSYLAIAGVVIYIAQLIAYFVIFVLMLQDLGFSLAGAAIPATAVSAAIALGAQSIVSDFLAGFFILTERHYGVGDWVRFEGGATSVEGTVIQITMRATRIRTLSEETVIIPNSEAGVSINNSNYWSSAVLVMPVPLLGSQSIAETMERAERAAKKALAQPAVAMETLGELNMQEPIDVTPPTTVGMPWTVSLRFLCQVKPGSQWQVERAMRTAVIAEFWEEYGSAPTLTGAVANSLIPTHNNDALADAVHEADVDAALTRVLDLADTPTQVMPKPDTSSQATSALHSATHDTSTAAHGAQAGDDKKDARQEPPTAVFADDDADNTVDGGGTQATAETEVMNAASAKDPETRLDLDLATQQLDAATTAPSTAVDGSEQEAGPRATDIDPDGDSKEALAQAAAENLPDAQSPARRILAALDPAARNKTADDDSKASEEKQQSTGFKARMDRILSFGGRTRSSTTILLLVLGLILLLKGFTYSNAETDTAGWLAPRTATSSTQEATVEEVTEPETSVESTTPASSEPTTQSDSGTTSTQTYSPQDSNTTVPSTTANQGTGEPTPQQTTADNNEPNLLQFFGSSAENSVAPSSAEPTT